MSNIDFYLMQTQIEIFNLGDEVRRAYELFPDEFMCFAFIDLVKSSRFRVERGAREGYIRSEHFFSIVRSVVRVCSDLFLIKEIGDEVMLASRYPRFLMEGIILIDLLIERTALNIHDVTFPFTVRSCIGAGIVKRIKRDRIDYIGTPIDRLARLMSVRDAGSSVLVGAEFVENVSSILPEYKDIIRLGPERILTLDESKNSREPILYRPLLVDRKPLLNADKNFIPWIDYSRARRR